MPSQHRVTPARNPFTETSVPEASPTKKCISEGIYIICGLSSPPLGKGLLTRIGELSNLSEKLKELSEGVSQIVETLKREHTSLKLEFEK
ncbi:hypothetical protein DRN48_07675 [Thermococci archaeon]|nr:MAG: hypothetical protein DRN48_07675 [Thermococci archaeon]